MANQEHLEILKKGVEQWNDWRRSTYTIPKEIHELGRTDRDDTREEIAAIEREYETAVLEWKNKMKPNLTPDLSNANLRGEDLANVDLRDVSLIGAKLSNAHLIEANLSNASLNGAYLWRTDLSEANLSKADLTGAELNIADLYGADLSWAILSNANLSNAILSAANLRYANLSNAIMSEADLSEANLRTANLSGADLSGANLSGADLSGADLSGANLSGADLSGADLSEAYLSSANLSGADLSGANLSEANLPGADLSGADFSRADLSGARLSGADLSEVNLTRTSLVATNLNNASITGSKVYGISAWDVKTMGLKQTNLVITKNGEPVVTVDDLEVAQFIYLMLNNDKIRNVLGTIAKKGVLILGRFTPERKKILDSIRDKLRELDFLPMMFDFEKVTSKDFTETIKILAGMSRFVIADISNPSSSPLELQATLPDYKIPFVPIIEAGQNPFAMFRDLTIYPWCLDVIEYDSEDNLIKHFQKGIIDRAIEVEASMMEQKQKFKKAPKNIMDL